MHEVAAMQAVVTTVLETMQRTGAVRVTGVRLILGASGHFTEEAARQHFQILTRDTPAEDAKLTISWIPATFQCFACLHRFESCGQADLTTCPQCGESALAVAHQDICAVDAIDVMFAGEQESVAPADQENR
ncbi:MAG TPA: hydrogenase maturation nickel metallochaperone HypA [Ktedonobacteraceae bacterium]|jgi:hydrogenase nickel insertion protein HypA|nr:hydrogenase maturation nickel metallochaperone HypA [Ktedonobacteraceae bacterium]